MQRFDDQALLLLVTGRSASDATSLVRSLYCCLTTQGSALHPTLRARAALPHPQLLSSFRGRTVSEKPGACNSSHLCLCVTGVIFSVVQTNPKIAQALQTPLIRMGLELHLRFVMLCRASPSPIVPKFSSPSAFIIISAGYDCSALRQSCFLNGTSVQVVRMPLLPALL